MLRQYESMKSCQLEMQKQLQVFSLMHFVAYAYTMAHLTKNKKKQKMILIIISVFWPEPKPVGNHALHRLTRPVWL